MQRAFRVKRSSRNELLILLPIFCAFLLLSLWMSTGVPPENRVHAAVGLGTFWFAWVVVCIVGLAHYARYRLVVTDDAIEQRTLFRSKKLPTVAPAKVEWRAGDKVIRLVGPDTQIVVSLRYFEPTDQLEFIQYIRHAFAEEWQEGWTLFAYKFVRPMLPDFKTREPESHEIRVTRRHRQVFLTLSTIAIAATVIISAWLAGRWIMLLGLLALLPIWLLIYGVSAREGEIVPRFSARNGDWSVLAFLALMLVLAAPAIMLADMVEHNGWSSFWKLAPMGGWMLVMFWLGRRMERAREAALLRSAQRWDCNRLDGDEVSVG